MSLVSALADQSIPYPHKDTVGLAYPESVLRRL